MKAKTLTRILCALLGGEAGDMVKALAFEGKKPYFFPTMGGKIWWQTVETHGSIRIQQNIISQHYRALDAQDGRICSSFELKTVRQKVLECLGDT